MSTRRGFVQALEEEVEMLRQSNNIEDVWDDLSLQQAIFAWKFLKQRAHLKIDAILKVHKILMLHQPLRPDEKGYFRRKPVFVGSAKTGYREGVPYQEIYAKMKAWIMQVEKTMYLGAIAKKDVTERIKQDHIDYEHIHPFIDGNGRTGRIFMNWQRSRLGLPLEVIHAGPEQFEYYKWFR